MSDGTSASDSCDVCGRTILAGEATLAYVTREGEGRTVCELCRSRAEAVGWIREGRSPQLAPAAHERGRGPSRIRRLLDRARESVVIATSRDQPSGAGTKVAPTAETEAVPGAAPDTPAAPPRRSVPQSPELRIRRAFDVFNASEHKRTVGGLIRSLGQPSVAAVSNGETPTEVRITVAWELAWYQWEVDLTGGGQAISAVAKGDEIEEIAEVDRDWNAHATEAGELEIGLGD